MTCVKYTKPLRGYFTDGKTAQSFMNVARKKFHSQLVLDKNTHIIQIEEDRFLFRVRSLIHTPKIENEILYSLLKI